MADTKIEWADVTWNPVRGCSRVSAGCMNCYAEHQALRITYFDRAKGVPEGQGAYDGLVTQTSQGPKWTGQIREVADKLTDPLGWRKPKRIFVNSMSDLFHPGVSVDYIAQVFAVMTGANWHTYQVLTKQAQRMHDVLRSKEFAQAYYSHYLRLYTRDQRVPRLQMIGSMYQPQPHVQLGVSTENQPAADERIPLLLQTPAEVRFISAEPLLGPIDLTCIELPPEFNITASCTPGRIDALTPDSEDRYYRAPARLDWVIAGGESGRGSRLMKADWTRSLRDQCQAAGVPFFFKQWGGADKKEAGRLLDGREWNEFPEAACAT